MRNGISFTVSASDSQRLQAIVAAPGSPHKHVKRVPVVLLSGDGLGTWAIMAETDKSKTCVWRWPATFPGCAGSADPGMLYCPPVATTFTLRPPENKIRPGKSEKAIQQHATLSVA